MENSLDKIIYSERNSCLTKIYSKLKSVLENSWKFLPIGLERYYGRNLKN